MAKIVSSIGHSGATKTSQLINDGETGISKYLEEIDVSQVAISGDYHDLINAPSTKSHFNSLLVDGDFLFVGDVIPYTDEQAQDAVGRILTDTTTIDFNYDDAANTIYAIVKDESITAQKLANNINVSKFINDAGYEQLVNKGAANGYVPLDANTKIPNIYLNDSVLGNVVYQGLWNQTTNVPNLDTVGPKGYYYICSGPTETTRYGLKFNTGDWIISNGTTWDKVDNTDAVTGFNSRTGNIIPQAGDYTTAIVADSLDKRYQTDNQRLFNDATSSIQTQLNNREVITNKISAITGSSTVLYPNEKAIVDYVNSKVGGSFAKVVYFNANDPNLATVFDTNNPPINNDDSLKENTSYLYVGANASNWVYNAGSLTYTTYNVNTASSNFFITGTNTDAGGIKTGSITKKGELVIDSEVNDVSGLKLPRIPSMANYSSLTTLLTTANQSTTAVDSNDNIFILSQDRTIRKITQMGVSSAFGTNETLTTGTGATIFVDTANNVFAYNTTSRIFTKTTPGGSTSIFGIGSVVSGGGASYFVIAPDGHLYYTMFNANVRRINKDTGADGAFVTYSSTVRYIILGADGNIYGIANNQNVIKITTAGAISVIATMPYIPDRLCAGPDGLAVSKVGQSRIFRITYAGISTEITSFTNLVDRMAYDKTGNLHIGSYNSSEVFVLAKDDTKITINSTVIPYDLAINSYGDVIVLSSSKTVKIKKETNKKVLKTDSQGNVVRTQYLEDVQYALLANAVDNSNVIHRTGYTTETKEGELVIDSLTPDVSGLVLKKLPNLAETSFTTISSGIDDGMYVIKASDGYMYVTDYTTGSVWKVDNLGNKTAFATGLSNPIGICVGIGGDFFVACQGDGNITRINKTTGVTSVFANTGVLQTGYICYASDGNFYVTSGNSSVSAIRKVSSAGAVSTFVTVPPGSNLIGADSILFSSDGNLYTATRAMSTERGIIKITLSGTITSIAANVTDLGAIYENAGGTLYANTRGRVSTVDKSTGVFTSVAFHSSVQFMNGFFMDTDGSFVFADPIMTSLGRLKAGSNKVLTTDALGKIIKTTYLEDVQYALAVNVPVDSGLLHKNGDETKTGSLTVDSIIKSGVATDRILLAGGGDISQSTFALAATAHNPVSIGTANGLSLSTQVLSMALATNLVTGALSNTDWISFNSRQPGHANLTSLAGLAYVSNAFVKMTGANTFSLDTTVYTSNTGTVTSIATAGTVSGLTLTGGTITTSGTITLGGTLVVTASNFASQAANAVLIGPNGSTGVPTFRLLVAADIPSLAGSYIQNGTGLQTANMNISGTGQFGSTVTATRFISTVATGTAPFTVASTTLVTNLNSDLLDGMQAQTTNVASSIVARDSLGNFSAGTVIANLTGNASGSSRFINVGSVASISDLNLVLTDTASCRFDTFSTAAANRPVALDNANGVITFNYNHSTQYAKQIAWGNSADLYTRKQSAGTWDTTWSKLWSSTNSNTTGFAWAASTLTLAGAITGATTGNFSGNVTAPTFTGALTGNASTATLATKASTLAAGGGNGAAMTFNWAGLGGQPTWLWGGNAQDTMNVYNPSNFSVLYAATANNLSGNVQSTTADINTVATNDIKYYVNATNSPSAYFQAITIGNGSDSIQIGIDSDNVLLYRFDKGAWKTGVSNSNIVNYAILRNNNSGTPVAAYYTSSATGGVGVKVRLPFLTNASKMLSFNVHLYQNYETYIINFSGYLYNTPNNWYSPRAIMLAGSTTINAVMGRDTDGIAYVWLAGGSYTGAAVFNVTGGFSNTDWNTGWTITNDATVPNQALNITVYPNMTTGNYNIYAPKLDGTGATGTWAIGITGNSANVNGVVAAANGGTGQSSYTVGDLLQANTTTTLSKLAAVATGNVLISGGVGVASSWGKVGLTTHVSGILDEVNGGTGQSVYAIGDILYASTTTVLSRLADVAIGNVLISGGIGVAPTWGKVTLTTHVSGVLPVANGGTGSSTAIVSGTTGTIAQFTAAGTVGNSIITQTSGAISVAGTVTATGGFFNSDARLKTVLKRDGDVVYFTWKDGRDNKVHVGYIAQEVNEYMPDAISIGNDDMMSVNYTEVLVQKVRSLEKEIEYLKSKLN